MDIIGERTLVNLLEEQAAHYGDRACMVHDPLEGEVSSLSFAALRDRVAQIGAGLRSAGMRKGDRVFIFLRNTADYVPLWLGVMCAGGVAVPGNIYLTASEVQFLLSDAEPTLIITEKTYLDVIRVALSTLEASPLIVVASDQVEDGQLSLAELSRESSSLDGSVLRSGDLAEIIYTSGTSSKPKGVMHTHANLLWCGLSAEGLGPDDRFFNNKPLFHANCQSTVLSCLTYGAVAIIGERYSATRYMSQLRRHRATVCSLSGMLCRTLLNQPHSEDDTAHEVRLGRYAINISKDEIAAFVRRFGIPLKNGYGMSEAMLTVTSEVRGAASTYPSIGRPAIGREVFIVDDENQQLASGQVGEIVVRGRPGRDLMLGYYRNEEATRDAFDGGWFHTGDLGWMDEQGNFFFFGRKKEVIKRSGENISAAEVEEVLATHPAVRDVAVIGVPDPVRDQAVKAFVVLREQGASPEELREHCRARLAYFKLPEHFAFVNDLPRNASGKVLKRELETL